MIATRSTHGVYCDNTQSSDGARSTVLVVGFQQRQAGDGPFSPSHAGASRARSLLSELLKDGALEQLHCDMAVDTEEEESEAEAYGLADSDFEAQLEAAEQFWATEDAYSEIPRTCTAPCSELSSVASEPIAIPATSYFKSDVQRAALNKLNEKRKWYAQQQENERMLCKSAIPESKALKQASHQQSRQPHLSYHRNKT